MLYSLSHYAIIPDSNFFPCPYKRCRSLAVLCLRKRRSLHTLKRSDKISSWLEIRKKANHAKSLSEGRSAESGLTCVFLFTPNQITTRKGISFSRRGSRIARKRLKFKRSCHNLPLTRSSSNG